MKALSIRQPHLQNIVNGCKKYEIRTWKVSYRGKILLCASKKSDTKNDFIKGHAVCIAELIAIHEMHPKFLKQAMFEVMPENSYAWELDNIKLIKPFPVKGQLGLFEIQI